MSTKESYSTVSVALPALNSSIFVLDSTGGTSAIPGRLRRQQPGARVSGSILTDFAVTITMKMLTDNLDNARTGLSTDWTVDPSGGTIVTVANVPSFVDWPVDATDFSVEIAATTAPGKCMVDLNVTFEGRP